MQFPIQTLVTFWVNHHLLDILQRPLWRVVKDRSQQYVRKVLAQLPDVHTSTAIAAVKRSNQQPNGPVSLVTEGGTTHAFDKVVFATHSDVTLRILGGAATPLEKEILGAIPYNDNDVYLHTG